MHRILKLNVIIQSIFSCTETWSLSDLTCPGSLNFLIAVARQNTVTSKAAEAKQDLLFHSPKKVACPQNLLISHDMGSDIRLWGLKSKYQVSLIRQSLART